MARHEEFTHIEPEAVMFPDYWEVGASGRRYGECILRLMDQDPPVDAAAAGWRSEDRGVRRLGTIVSSKEDCIA